MVVVKAPRRRCAWCGREGTRAFAPALTPLIEWCVAYERRHGVRLLFDEPERPGTPSSWWCTSSDACRRRRGERVAL